MKAKVIFWRKQENWQTFSYNEQEGKRVISNYLNQIWNTPMKKETSIETFIGIRMVIREYYGQLNSK